MKTKTHDIIFVREKRNKHSIRVLAAAFEIHYPGRDYTICSPETLDIHAHEAALVLCSFNTTKADEYYSLVKRVRSECAGVHFACGGPHPTARSDEALQYFDTVCVGEGERTLKHIIDSFDKGDGALGIINGERVAALEEFPAFAKRIVQLGPIEIMRGCVGRCHYCQTPQLFQGKIRYRSVESIADEINFCITTKPRDMDVRFITSDASFYCYDNGVNFTEIERLFVAINNTLHGRGRIFFGSFPSELEPSRVSAELVELMKRYCGNKSMVIGLQSGSSEMLEKMNRKSTVDDAENAIRLLLQAGYDVVVDLIFGLPYETEKTLKETLKWIEHWKDKVIIHAHPFFPMPGSKWEHELPTQVPESMLTLLRSMEGSGNVFGKYY